MSQTQSNDPQYSAADHTLPSIDADEAEWSTSSKSVIINTPSSSTSSASEESRDEKHAPERNSIAYFMHRGFNPSTAATLLLRYNDLKAIGTNDDGLEVATCHVRSSAYDAACTEDDWKTAMEKLGIAEELQEAILVSGCGDMRETESLEYWLVDTFGVRDQDFEARLERQMVSSIKAEPSGRSDREDSNGVYQEEGTSGAAA